MASCLFSPAKRAEIILSKKGNLAMRTRLNFRIMILVICAALTFLTGGLDGGVEKKKNHSTAGGLQQVLQPVTDSEDPFSGTWVLNLSKSKIPSQYSTLKSQIAHVVTDASGVEITQETVFESEERFIIQVKGKFDGKDYPIIGAPGSFSAAYQRVDKNIIKAVLKMDGNVVIQETGVVSLDGKSLAVIYYITDPSGKQVTIIAVYEKK